MTDALAPTTQSGVVPATAPDAMALLTSAVERGTPVETIEKLVDLHERMERRAAAQALNTALAAFQQSVPDIPKTHRSNQVSGHGVDKPILYAPLAVIMGHIRPHLVANGLSVTWDSTEGDGRKRVTCTVMHIDGGEKSATFECPQESRAGMSAQQKAASANTYGMRYSLIMVLGLTTVDPDMDGVDTDDLEPASAEQIDEVKAEMVESKADPERFLAYLQIEALNDMTRGHYRKAKAGLAQKRKGAP